MNYTIATNNPHLQAGFELIECPYCRSVCYPDARTLNDHVIYNRHLCIVYGIKVYSRFEIDADGELIEREGI